MTDVPVFIPTSAGTIGAILSVPDREPRAAVVMLDGVDGTRAGTNRIWARTAAAMAEAADVLVLRADWAGYAESHEAPLNTRTACVLESVRWLREQAGDLDLLLFGYCYGVQPVIALTEHETAIRAIGLVTPPYWTGEGLFEDEDAPATQPAPTASPSIARRARLAVYRARKAVFGKAPKAIARAARAVRYGRGPNVSLGRRKHWVQRTPEEQLRLLSAVTPVWMLAGEQDKVAPQMRQLEPLVRDLGGEVELVPGPLYQVRSAEQQELMIERVRAWAVRCTAVVEARA